MTNEPVASGAAQGGGCGTDGPLQAVTLAEEAMADSPSYVEHIGALFSDCVCHLRAGYDFEGLNMFARGTDDLNQFVELFERVCSVARPKATDNASAFRHDLVSCMRELERALVDQDLVSLCDRIEGQLLPILPRWEPVAEEIASGLQSRRS